MKHRGKNTLLIFEQLGLGLEIKEEKKEVNIMSYL